MKLQTVQFVVILAFVILFPYINVYATTLLFAAVGLQILGGINLNFKDFLMLFYAAFAVLPASESEIGIHTYLGVVVYGWLISIVFQNVKLTPVIARILLYSFLASSALMWGIMYFQIQPGVFEFSLEYILSKNRNLGFFFVREEPAGATTIASIITVSIIILISLIASSKKFITVKLAALVICYFFLILSGGRAAILVNSVIIFVPALVFLRHRFSKQIALWAGLAVGLIALAITFFFLVLPYQGRSFADRADGMLHISEDSSVQGRFELWRYAWALVLENPAGYGHNYFSQEFELTPHNEVLGQFVGGGMVAGCLFLAIWIYLGLKTLSIFRITPEYMGVGFAAMAMYIAGIGIGMPENYSMSSNNIFYPFVWAFFGLIINISKNCVHNRSRPEQRETYPAPQVQPA